MHRRGGNNAADVDAIKSRAEEVEKSGQREFGKIEAGDASIDCPSAASTLSSHEAALVRSQQDNDDSDGGVMLIAKKSKTYVGPDIVKIDGKYGRECVRSYSEDCSAVEIGTMGTVMRQSDDCCRRKEFAVTKSLGGFDGMEGLARQARPA